jgi:phospholipid transport system transporter-binding protein
MVHKSTEPHFQESASGRLEVHGELSLASVPGLWREYLAGFADRSGVDLDLCCLERSDSAGLVFLLACFREATRAGHSIRFFNLPEQMLAVVRVSSLDDVLPLYND